MAVQYGGHMIQTETHDNNTALPLVEVFRRFEIGFVFVGYNLFKPTICIQHFIYIYI